MNGCGSEVTEWPLTYLDTEPIFSSPPPENPNDIICPGSHEETNEATRAAKRRRYELIGRRYLEGRPLRIFSASLRGPFDQASGWQNPWLPKPSSQVGQCLEHVARPLLDDDILSTESSTDQVVDDSMDCHLPSPQSHEDLQFPKSPLTFKSRSGVESWARNVGEDVLEQDEFWAPTRVSAGFKANSAKKHPADTDWLKRRPAKRRRPDASQSTEPTSTPTPLPTAPAKPKNKKESVAAMRYTNRSFEMTTPSSSPGKGPGDSPDPPTHQAVVPYEEDRQSVSSTTSTPVSRTSSQPSLQTEGEEESENEEHVTTQLEDEESQDAEASTNVHPSEPYERTSHDDGELQDADETINFQDCVDDSFCYQARHVKRDASPLAPTTTVTDCPSSQIPTETSGHGDAVMQQSDPSTREFISDATCTHSDINNIERTDEPGKTSIADILDGRTECPSTATLALGVSRTEDHKATPQSCHVASTMEDINYAPKTNVGQPLSDITSNSHASRLNIRRAVPLTISEVKEAPNINTDSFFDEGPTLIGDVMDTEEPEHIEPVEQEFNNHFLKSTSLLQHYAISATNLANASKLDICSNTAALNVVNGVAISATSTISQQGLAEPQLKPTEPCLQEVVNSEVDADTLLSEDDQGIYSTLTEDEARSAEQQSPWAASCTVDESLPPSDGNKEQAEAEPEEKLTQQALATSLDSPAPMHCIPNIRPSQQSPWVKEAAAPMNETRLDTTTIMNTAARAKIALPSESQHLLFPTNQEHQLWTASSPAIPPVSEESSRVVHGHQYIQSSAVTEREARLPVQNLLNTPISRMARQSTPDGEVSIRSFSNFDPASPQQSIRPPGSSISRGILSSTKRTSARSSMRSNRRVSFAPLPHEEECDTENFTKPRAASPPLSAPAPSEGEDINSSFRRHFDIMNRRLRTYETPNLRYHQRLLPSSSQQKPESPSVTAMAEVFREADAHLLDHVDVMNESAGADEAGTGVAVVEERPQSPWQHDTQAIDDVAAVLGNLSDFLDVWDVDTEIDRNRTEMDEALEGMAARRTMA